MQACECGCGRPAPIADRARRDRGWVKGQPIRFISGHNARQDPVARFWRHVHKTETCWLWTGGRIGKYGSISISQRCVLAHRFSYELHIGQIPDGLFVCHTCDTPPCVNPAHLFLGTNADNMADKIRKGRHDNGHRKGTRPKGENVYCAKLTEAHVRAIRKACAGPMPRGVVAALARKYGVTGTAIYGIRVGRTWKGVV